jgi:hypothetical protein
LRTKDEAFTLFKRLTRHVTDVRWFLKDNLALGIEARYFHLSCANLYSPNLGLNSINGLLGLSWFF